MKKNVVKVKIDTTGRGNEISINDCVRANNC